jgi:formylmethanofuran dehydrogenase subunit C
MAEAFFRGWRRFIVFGLKGQRFHGCGFGPDSGGVRMDIYGSSGDYLGSAIDGLSIFVHGNAQDQLGQIMKSGKLVVYGDVGQTFMYGAKGGEVYVMGNAAGRPLINAVGRLSDPGKCVEFFLTDNADKASALAEELKKDGIPTLLVEMDETGSSEGQLKTRFEAFFEMIGG